MLRIIATFVFGVVFSGIFAITANAYDCGVNKNYNPSPMCYRHEINSPRTFEVTTAKGETLTFEAPAISVTQIGEQLFVLSKSTSDEEIFVPIQVPMFGLVAIGAGENSIVVLGEGGEKFVVKIEEHLNRNGNPECNIYDLSEWDQPWYPVKSTKVYLNDTVPLSNHAAD